MIETKAGNERDARPCGPASGDLYCIAYFSTMSPGVDECHVKDIFDVSRCRNVALDVTGVLGYYDSSFFQILEGGEAAVNDVFARIAIDHRHCSVTPIFRSPIDSRSFQDWSMALVEPRTLGPERQAFCVYLATLSPQVASSHRNVVTTVIGIFNQWVR